MTFTQNTAESPFINCSLPCRFFNFSKTPTVHWDKGKTRLCQWPDLLQSSRRFERAKQEACQKTPSPKHTGSFGGSSRAGWNEVLVEVKAGGLSPLPGSFWVDGWKSGARGGKASGSGRRRAQQSAQVSTLYSHCTLVQVIAVRTTPEVFDTIVSVSKIRYFWLKVSYPYRNSKLEKYQYQYRYRDFSY